MREGYGGIAYGIRKAARALVLLFAFVLLFSMSRQQAQAANIYYGNGTITAADLAGEDEDAEASPTEAPEATPTPKPKKQMAAEQYALGVILAGGIAIGMMVAVFFYYTKQNNQRD